MSIIFNAFNNNEYFIKEFTKYFEKDEILKLSRTSSKNYIILNKLYNFNTISIDDIINDFDLDNIKDKKTKKIKFNEIINDEFDTISDYTNSYFYHTNMYARRYKILYIYETKLFFTNSIDFDNNYLEHKIENIQLINIYKIIKKYDNLFSFKFIQNSIKKLVIKNKDSINFKNLSFQNYIRYVDIDVPKDYYIERLNQIYIYIKRQINIVNKIIKKYHNQIKNISNLLKKKLIENKIINQRKYKFYLTKLIDNIWNFESDY